MTLAVSQFDLSKSSRESSILKNVSPPLENSSISMFEFEVQISLLCDFYSAYCSMKRTGLDGFLRFLFNSLFDPKLRPVLLIEIIVNHK